MFELLQEIGDNLGWKWALIALGLLATIGLFPLIRYWQTSRNGDAKAAIRDSRASATATGGTGGSVTQHFHAAPGESPWDSSSNAVRHTAETARREADARELWLKERKPNIVWHTPEIQEGAQISYGGPLR